VRIGFLFNHDQIHQVAHSLPIALALARSSYRGEILVATTTPRLAHEVRRLGGPSIGTRISHVDLSLAASSRVATLLLGGLVPAQKLLVYRDNLEFFRSLDVLVVAEKTSLVLKTRYGLRKLKIVHTRHGAGDRAIGFNKASAGFDHVLCSGRKIRERLVRDAGVPRDRISIVGYPKFDHISTSASLLMPPPARPVVLYNPHPSPHLSSWYRHGRAILDFFVGNDDYELIFAPHVMLFERRIAISIDPLRAGLPGRIAARYLRSPNIHIDLGSRSSTDMTYTQAADIYIGDASSQVYEYLYRPRPCLFLNSHSIEWRNDASFEHWNAGPVITRPEELGNGLRHALSTHANQYRAIQQEMFDRTFDLSERPSSQRAAEAIQRFSERNVAPVLAPAAASPALMADSISSSRVR